MNNNNLWTKNFIIICISNLFLYLILYLMFTTISVFAIDEFNANTSEAGLATGIFIIGVLIARIVAGRYVDSFGPKKTLYLGLVLTVITTFCYFIVSNLILLDIVRVMHGLSLGTAITGTGAIVARVVPTDKRGEGIGYFALSNPLGAGLGPLIGMMITQHFSFNVNIMLCAILAVVSFGFSFFLKVPEIEVTEEQLKESKKFKFTNFFESKAIPIAFIALLVGTGYASIISFLNTFAIEIDVVDIASFFFLFYAISTAISRPLVGKWFDKKGENFVLYPAFIVLAIGLIFLSQAQTAGWFILLAGVFVGLGYGTFTASGQAIAVQESATHRSGLATSTFYIFLDGGAGIAPTLLGLFIPFIGFSGLYLVTSVLVIIAGVLYVLLHGRKKGAAYRKSAI